MNPRIEIISQKKLVGKSIRMSLVNNLTFELWSSFMPHKKHIKNTLNSDLYSMQIYDSSTYYDNFNPNQEFTKWATIEVSNFDNVLEGLNTYTLEGGLYAVFIHKGLAFDKTVAYIFKDWMPNSEYELDHRAHFEVLGEKYKKNHPDSEEEVWIPIRLKNDE